LTRKEVSRFFVKKRRKKLFTDSPRLHRRLSSLGVLLLTLSSLSPVLSIYGIGGQVLQQAGTGAAGLFLLGLAAAVVWAMVYAELGSAFPYAGGDYVGVGTILGGWAGMVTLAIWAASAGPANAFEAQIIATYLGPLFPAVPPMAITLGAMAAAIVIALLAVRFGALVTGIFLTIEMLAVVTLIGAGFWHPARGLAEVLAHPLMPGSHGALVPETLGVFALAAVSTVYGTVGGNQALYFGEELGDPHRRMGRVVVIACMTGAFATALPVIAVVLGARDFPAILVSPAPFAAFISEKTGPWAGQALGAGVALAIFNALIASLMAFARLYYSMGRDGVLPAAFGRVDGASGVPRVATLVVGVFSILCCFLATRTLLIFTTGLVVYGWGLVCLAVLVGRRRGLTGGPGYWRARGYPVAPMLGLLMALVFAAADWADPEAGRPSLLIMGVVAATAVLWQRFRLPGWIPGTDKTPM
jgi:amino acid transporter